MERKRKDNQFSRAIFKVDIDKAEMIRKVIISVMAMLFGLLVMLVIGSVLLSMRG